MTGLEVITEKILLDSRENCEKILEEGALKVKEILSEARNKGNLEAESILSAAEKEAERKNSIAKSSAESITRNRYLEIRNAILNDIISAAYESVEKLPNDEYFDLIRKLCYKHIQTGECTMYFNGEDLYRLPDGFEDEINSSVFETGAVHVCREPIDIENGFILKYEGFEVNCTFRAVFDDCMDNLKFVLSKALFD